MSPVRVTWAQALAWRLRRQLLDPVADVPPDEVVRRLCGVQAQVASAAELAIRVRLSGSAPGEVGAALAEGRLVKTWAMRGTLHLLTPEDAGAFLSVLAAGRTWERPSWQRYFGLGPADWEVVRPAVREALDGRALTREELVEAIVARSGLGHVADALRSGWGTLLKPLAWQGDLCHGPARGNRVTFTRPEVASACWRAVPPVDEGGPRAVAAYLGAYGPASEAGFASWMLRGWAPKRAVRSWFAALADRLAEVEVGGERAYVLAEDVDELVATSPSTTVRLLPGFDQWVLGPGTDDAHVIPAGRRAAVSRPAGWIAPVVVLGGVVAGTWDRDGDRVRVSWFGEAGRVPTKALEAEVDRLASIAGPELGLEVKAV